jgi:hypothetical protein
MADPSLCPLLIHPMSTALGRAVELHKQYPSCFSSELVAIGSKVAIAGTYYSAAEHMIRTSGVMASMVQFADLPIPPEIRQAWFWAATEHDNLKLAESIYPIISDEDKRLDDWERQKLPDHIASFPFALRQEHRFFRISNPTVLQLAIAGGTLHHVLSSGYPLLVQDPLRPWIPTLDELGYSHSKGQKREDLQLLQAVYQGLEETKSMTHLDDVRELASRDFTGLAAVFVAFLTGADIIDATHRRSYQNVDNWEQRKNRINEILTRYSGFSEPLRDLFLDWLATFSSELDYSLHALQTGWRDYAPGAIQRHLATHGSGEDCGFVTYLKENMTTIPMQSQIHSWLTRCILPSMLFQ